MKFVLIKTGSGLVYTHLKNKFFKAIILQLTFIFISCAGTTTSDSISDSIAISVQGKSRVFTFTNKFFGQFHGETNAYSTDGWHGWTLKEQRIFNDYILMIGNDSVEREKSRATVTPYNLIREYPGSFSETLTFADSLDLLIIQTNDKAPDSIKLTNFNGRFLKKTSDNILEFDLSDILPAMKFIVASNSGITRTNKYDNFTSISFGQKNVPFVVIFQVIHQDSLFSFPSIENLTALKKKRLDKLLNAVKLTTNDEEFNKAFLWAVASLDALITTQGTKGIFAGLPWFNNNWGRDTFISLPGATFVNGNFAEAKEILKGFAEFQDKNPSSIYFGRIPNRVTLKESIYNTTDGTPWFVIQLYEYFLASADTAFVKEMYPVVKTAFEGAQKNYVDYSGFLTHADAETWMDAVGPDGPWSPRGNRANDIQALWFRQLDYTAKMAEMVNDAKTQLSCIALKAKLFVNFQKLFIDKNSLIIYDHLNSDNSPSSEIRPNALFALNDAELIPDAKLRTKILSKLTKEIISPYGVLSLSPNDDGFHPFHQYPPYYVKDAAYHNGIIWQWNTGPAVKALCDIGLQDSAWVLTKDLTRQILTDGAVGTLAELSDALPRSGEKYPRLSGAFSQAWSLAEYIRNFRQNYLGIIPHAPSNSLYIIPSLPKDIDYADATAFVGNKKIKLSYRFNDSFYRISLKPVGPIDSIDIGIGLVNRAGSSFQLKTDLKNNDELIVEVPAHSLEKSDLRVMRNGSEISVSFQFYEPSNDFKDIYASFQLAQPFIKEGLKSLKGPDYRLLKNSDVKQTNTASERLLNVKDPARDEIYSYPTNINFKKGILDLTSFELSEDSENYFFKFSYSNLSNPGWHPEYGFQLTLSAIYLSVKNSSFSTSQIAGKNSGYIFAPERKYTTAIIVGGGLEIKDASGKTLAVYTPVTEDVKNPLGNTQTGTISFSIPKSILGIIDTTSPISILTGAQDDHGGAGVGEFRSVLEKSSEWNGGGKRSPSGHNIYDFLFIN